VRQRALQLDCNTRWDDDEGDAMSVMPTAEQFAAFTEWDHDGPVTMINLLKFAERDGAADGEGSGRDSYRRYGDAVISMVEERGGKVVWSGRPGPLLIGGEHDEWDLVVLVEYPAKEAFLDMVSQPSYQTAHKDRAGGLARTALIPTISGTAVRDL
jgi:uncharacterized protein (DUF1330 family)